MVDVKLLIEKLLHYASKNLYLNEVDVVFKRNVLLSMFKIDEPLVGKLKDEDFDAVDTMTVPDELYNEIKEYALESFSVDEDDADRFAVNVFSELSPLPSTVIQTFKRLRELRGAHVACEYLYNLSIKNNYIRKSMVERNDNWFYEGDYSVELSINALKKELPNDSKSDDEKQSVYPKCLICHENQGFTGNANYLASANLICTSVELAKETWYLQYSPFAFFKEHCLVVSEQHVPMRVDEKTVDKQFDFIEYIPEYFVVSNADLPNINGVIGEHQHYYGGNKYMPIFGARKLIEFSSQAFPDVEISLIDWPVASIRLSGFNRNTIKEVYAELIQKWKEYEDPDGIIQNDKNNRHNSAVVISRFLPDGKYCAEVILRNNMTSDACPNGVYGIPDKYLNIKKENLGAMEFMGLFILPERLKSAIEKISEFLCDKNKVKTNDFSVDDLFDDYKDMINEILVQYGNFKDSSKAETAIKDYIGNSAIEILKNTSVFKLDDEGIFNLRKFLATLSIK